MFSLITGKPSFSINSIQLFFKDNDACSMIHVQFNSEYFSEKKETVFLLVYLQSIKNTKMKNTK